VVMQFVSRMNSYLGIMKHYHTFRLRQHIIQKKLNPGWWKYIFVKGRFLTVVRKKIPRRGDACIVFFRGINSNDKLATYV
jgi:hypothetical protein